MGRVAGHIQPRSCEPDLFALFLLQEWETAMIIRRKAANNIVGPWEDDTGFGMYSTSLWMRVSKYR